MKINLAISIIKNGSLSYKANVHVPTTKINLNFVSLLYTEGYIRGFFYNSKRITVFLKYTEFLVPVIKNIKTVSTSGRLFPITYKTLSKIPKNSGTLILHTIKGLITSKRAKYSYRIGGVVLCKII